MSKTIALVGALDTKGAEYAFVKTCLEARGLRTLVIDSGVLGAPTLTPYITRQKVALAGGIDAAAFAALVARADRGEAVEAMSAALAKLLPVLHAAGRFDGVIALGGTGGTSVACRALRALPLGVPKVMVSTVAGTDVSAYVGVSDIVMIPSIVDVAGINRLSRSVLARAAGAVAGMVETLVPAAAPGAEKPLIAASMFGNTTAAINVAKPLLEAAGFEVLVFHATGNGGRTMESLIASGAIVGVFDLTTTELVDDLVGGVFTAGPDRLNSAVLGGVPALVAPGCLDMVNFGAPATVPAKFAGRRFYKHNANVTLMRSDVAENRALGEQMAAKLNASRGPVVVLIPLLGLSVIGAPGGAFHWPEADAALFAALKSGLRPDIRVVELDLPINDPAFARRCTEEFIALLSSAKS